MSVDNHCKPEHYGNGPNCITLGAIVRSLHA